MKNVFIALKRRAFATARSACVAAIVVAVAVSASSWTSAHAEGSLETMKGGLFHRKGFIRPEIHRKREPRIDSSQRTNLGGPVARRSSVPKKPVTTAARRRVQAGTRRKAARPAAQNRRRATRMRQVRRQINRQIPKQVVQKSEGELEKVERRQAQRAKQRRVRVASLGQAARLPEETGRKGKSSVTGGGAAVQWVASSGCVPARLKQAIYHVARKFGRVRVTSTCRSRSKNRRIGGASRSWHLLGKAADIRVFGNIGGAARYLRSVAGGFKHYGGGLFHIDTGPRRSW